MDARYTEPIASMPTAVSVWAGLQTALPFNCSTAPSSSLTMSHTHKHTHTDTHRANRTQHTCHEADWIYTASIIHPHIYPQTHPNAHMHTHTECRLSREKVLATNCSTKTVFECGNDHVVRGQHISQLLILNH